MEALAKKRTQPGTELEKYFSPFRQHVIGYEQTFRTVFGEQPIVYADWTASGRLYRPIEDILSKEIAPFVGNTHTETTVTGNSMTLAYHHAKHLIKEHLGADPSDVLISSNSGMTGVVNKFQRILGLKVHEKYVHQIQLSEEEQPVIFVTHMEHHSNQTSWLETLAKVEVIGATTDGLVDLDSLRNLLQKYRDRKTKIAAVTSCSNVTGIRTPYHAIAGIMHQHGGLCFVDFACSAPYIEINMRPDDPGEHLDALYFSPHKFLGGPATTGILIFDPELYKNRVPDNPGGGTVNWTNPWGGHRYIEEIEMREDGGTPAFLQTMKVALCFELKAQMGVQKMLQREEEMLALIWERFDQLPELHVLADNHRHRLGVISFYIEDLHYNLGVKLLNDRFGIQVRGGCSCAGTYGHYLLHVSEQFSQNITHQIDQGILSAKPGWIRLSIHPVMSTAEIEYILDAIEELYHHHKEWSKKYVYHGQTNEFVHPEEGKEQGERVRAWFKKELI